MARARELAMARARKLATVRVRELAMVRVRELAMALATLQVLEMALGTVRMLAMATPARWNRILNQAWERAMGLAEVRHCQGMALELEQGVKAARVMGCLGMERELEQLGVGSGEIRDMRTRWSWRKRETQGTTRDTLYSSPW